MVQLLDTEKRLLMKGLRDNGCMGPWTECADYEHAYAAYVATLPETDRPVEQIAAFVEFATDIRNRSGGFITNILQKIIQSLINQVKPTEDTAAIDWTPLIQKLITALLNQIKPAAGTPTFLAPVTPKPKPAPTPTPTPTPGPIV